MLDAVLLKSKKKPKLYRFRNLFCPRVYIPFAAIVYEFPHTPQKASLLIATPVTSFCKAVEEMKSTVFVLLLAAVAAALPVQEWLKFQRTSAFTKTPSRLGDIYEFCSKQHVL